MIIPFFNTEISVCLFHLCNLVAKELHLNKFYMLDDVARDAGIVAKLGSAGAACHGPACGCIEQILKNRAKLPIFEEL